MLAVRFMNVKTSLSERPSANFAHYDESAAHQTGAGQRPGCPFRDELSLPSERLARSQCQPLVHQAAPHNQRGNPFWRAAQALLSTWLRPCRACSIVPTQWWRHARTWCCTWHFLGQPSTLCTDMDTSLLSESVQHGLANMLTAGDR